MSARALKGLSIENRTILEKAYRIIASDIHTIEKIGGGSAKSMVAELF